MNDLLELENKHERSGEISNDDDMHGGAEDSNNGENKCDISGVGCFVGCGDVCGLIGSICIAVDGFVGNSGVGYLISISGDDIIGSSDFSRDSGEIISGNGDFTSGSGRCGKVVQLAEKLV